ncbi:hypothetical protein KC19_9G063100 [Ceratodon purpureus]|uniref:Uncharacterized protein n=1 Tax=Ceratodon purpureus TaxID=3225 RepID=A0A8T0GP97_CERPU|nr:hypothetical protein KC19_9G063100 [Ceratodon purpureus]
MRSADHVSSPILQQSQTSTPDKRQDQKQFSQKGAKQNHPQFTGTDTNSHQKHTIRSSMTAAISTHVHTKPSTRCQETDCKRDTKALVTRGAAIPMKHSRKNFTE